MSVMNKALSELANTKKSSLEQIEKAQVAPVKSRPVWVWVAAGFGLSLAVGGWAVSQQATVVQTEQSMIKPIEVQTFVVPEQIQVQQTSPTQKTNQLDVAVYRSAPIEVEKETIDEPVVEQDVAPAKPVVAKKVEQSPESKRVGSKPILLASNTSAPVVKNEPPVSSSSSVVVEQVEMSPEKLAEKAISRANKAMEANDFQNAVRAYREALRYTPDNEEVRKKLAALYYGKGDVRKAFDLLQRGIELNPDGEALRIALTKFLVRENQSEAALSPLVHLPPAVSTEYLSLRAALAQKTKQNEIALESYQKLTEKESSNARWWLGLAIQQERGFLLNEAKTSYQNALTKVGVSSQSQAFIRDRLEVLNNLEESKSGD